MASLRRGTPSASNSRIAGATRATMALISAEPANIRAFDIQVRRERGHFCLDTNRLLAVGKPAAGGSRRILLLRLSPRRGKGPLTAEEADQVRGWITDGTPDGLGLPFAPWTSRALRQRRRDLPGGRQHAGLSATLVRGHRSRVRSRAASTSPSPAGSPADRLRADAARPSTSGASCRRGSRKCPVGRIEQPVLPRVPYRLTRPDGRTGGERDARDRTRRARVALVAGARNGARRPRRAPPRARGGRGRGEPDAARRRAACGPRSAGPGPPAGPARGRAVAVGRPGAPAAVRPRRASRLGRPSRAPPAGARPPARR